MKIGTCIRGTSLLEDLKHAVSLGVDSVFLYYNETLANSDFSQLYPMMQEIIGDSGVTISGVGLAIEGFHDPIFRDEREWEGHKLALSYLTDCLRSVQKP